MFSPVSRHPLFLFCFVFLLGGGSAVCIHTLASTYCTEHKPKDKNGGGLGMRLLYVMRQEIDSIVKAGKVVVNLQLGT